MKNLLDIVKILTKKKIAKIEILDEQTLKQKDSLFGKFYEGLVTGKIETDEEAAKMLYGVSDSGHAKYRQLKSRFRRRLLNTLFFIDANMPHASNYDLALLSSSKEWAIVEILFAYDAKQSAINLARHIFNTALKFQLTSLIVKTAQLLRNAAAEEEDEKSFRYFNNHIEEYLPLLAKEMEAENLYQNAILLYWNNERKKESIKKIELIGNTLVQLSEKDTNPIVHYNLYKVWTIYYELLSDYEGMLEVCQNGVQFLKENSDLFQGYKISFFYIKILAAYLHQRHYQNGKKHAEEVLSSIPEESTDWLIFMKHYLLLSLHTDNFINALAIFNKVANASSYKKMDALQREEWDLIEVALHYLVELQGSSTNLLPKQRRKAFKMSDFINRKGEFQLKSANLTVQRIALQILFLLHRRSHTGIPERIEQLKTLAKYELKREGFERGYAFVKLLHQLNKSEFNLKKLRNTEKFLQKLKSNTFIYKGNVSQLEILPYETLWKLMCSYFDEHIKKSKIDSKPS